MTEVHEVPVRLTAYQRELLWKLQAWSRQNGGMRPTYRELMEYTRASSTSVVAHNLKKLSRLGLVEMVAGRACSAKVSDEGMRELGLTPASPPGLTPIPSPSLRDREGDFVGLTERGDLSADREGDFGGSAFVITEEDCLTGAYEAKFAAVGDAVRALRQGVPTIAETVGRMEEAEARAASLAVLDGPDLVVQRHRAKRAADGGVGS